MAAVKSLFHYLSFLTTPADQSIIEGVHKLEPGHMITLKPGARPRVSSSSFTIA